MGAGRDADVVSVVVAVPAVADAGIPQVDDAPVVHDVVVAPVAFRPSLASGPAGEFVIVDALLVLVLRLASVVLRILALVLGLLGPPAEFSVEQIAELYR